MKNRYIQSVSERKTMTTLTEERYQTKIRELEKEVKKLNLIIQKDSKTKYGLRWIDVPEAFEKESENKIPILEEVKDKAIKNNDGKPTHILIEGDNYHALKCLNYTHKGKIDVIYIDPPYNTGDKKGGKFVYKDNRFLKEFPDGRTIIKDDPLRHSSWLSFMTKRLELAKNLLKETGILCISIDDYEQANLKLLCNQIFGESNFVNQFVWKRNSSGKTEVDKFTVNTEYVLLYRKSEFCKLYDAFKPLSESTVKLYNKNDNDGRGRYRLYPLQKPQDPGPETTYDYVDNNGKIWKCPPKGWRMKESKLKELENDGRLCLDNDTLSEKAYWNERENEGKRIDTLWDDLPENSAGTSQLTELFNNKVIFSNPKPTELIRRCIQIGSKDCIVLDFFAGSGTTLQSTIKLNQEDSGKRQCIIVQAKEPLFEIKEGKQVPMDGAKVAFEEGYRYIPEITYERNRRVMQGYKNPKREEVSGLGNSLKYYRTAFIGENEAEYATDKDKITLSKKAGCLLSMAENTLEEYISTDRYQIFGDDKNSFTGIYFSANADKTHEFAAKLEQLRNLSALNTVNAYFFSSGDGTEFSEEFESLKNIKIKSIPEPILEVYRRLN